MNMHLFLEHLYKKKINNLMISNFNQIYFRILMISGWIVKKNNMDSKKIFSGYPVHP